MWIVIRKGKQKMILPYKDLDIAQYILSLCDNEVELQRVAEELLIYQDRDLFDLLRYLINLLFVETHYLWLVFVHLRVGHLASLNYKYLN